MRALSRGRALVLGLLALLLVAAGTESGDEVTLEYFWGHGCPFCELQAEFLDDLEARYPELVVERYEVWDDASNQQRFVDALRSRGVEPTGVPATVLGDQVWVGFDERVGASIEQAVVAALDEAVDEPEADEAPPTQREVVNLPILGEVDLTGRSLIGATLLIGFVDGFNPCSLWVLTVLLAMVINAGGSRARLAVVGVTFLTITALVYGLFIAGLFSVFLVAGISTWIAVAVGLLAIGFGVVNVKDYLYYKRGLSLTIPDRYKPRIYRGGRAVRDQNRPLPVVLGITVVLAAGVALLELPCTAGFPVVWTGLLTAQGVAGAEFTALLGSYLLVYLGVEVAILVLVLVTLRLGAVEERQGRILKLIGGVVMIVLGGVLVVAPDVMEGFVGSTAVVFGAIVAALGLLVLHRAVLPRLGIHLGDETPSPKRPVRTGRR